jgi:hypothetical protein
MTLILGVDTERLMSTFFRAQPEMTALVGDRIYTELPTQAVPPLLRLNLIGGAPVGSRPLWLDESFIQLDAYGGPKVVAREVIDTARALLWDPRFLGTHPGLGVVTCVEFVELSYIPDDGYEPARPRYVATVSVYVHPET